MFKEVSRTVKANQNRRNRFSFGVDSGRYDRGRPAFSARIVHWALAKSGFTTGDRVLEIGAGSGQLTGELLRAGAEVTALEPSEELAKLLRSKYAGREFRLEVHEATFEGFEAGEEFAMVTAANAFHWIDPNESYRKAADVLALGGRLCLLWYFPILANSALQHRVNATVREHGFDGLAREPERYGEALVQPLAEGREEIEASGHFRCEKWLLEPISVRCSVTDYLDLLATFDSARDLTPLRSSLLGSVFHDVAGINLTVFEYACVAHPT